MSLFATFFKLPGRTRGGGSSRRCSRRSTGLGLGVLMGLAAVHQAAWAASVQVPAQTGATTPPPALHWAFQPVVRPGLPAPADVGWALGPIDRFVRLGLERAGLEPNPMADARSWLRRVHLDLVGLPPTAREVQDFVRADSQDSRRARAEAVERLLASPRYGERWAQHWLDVVRYADTDGFEVNTERANAWPYRDYVVEAFNADRPYDRFVREQLAGDRLGVDAATGFLVTAAALLPGQIGQDDVSKRLARQDELAELVGTAGQTLLGLSIGCARCHDHKFDPISAADYYRFQACFAGVFYGERPLESPERGPRLRPEEFGPPIPAPPGFVGRFAAAEPTFRLHRGDPEQPRERVEPAVPVVLGQRAWPESLPESERREALANWLTDPRHPLTARVMVNRLWQGHFGVGLVSSPNDFGLNGARPSHPELLDWLADEFVRGGWSMKHLHRLMVLSATYAQSDAVNPRAQAVDADNRWLWRFASRRVEAETLRDCVLAVSGQLNLQAGGRGFDLFKSRGGLTGFPPVETFPAGGLRRMVWAHKVRMEKDAVFGAFDCPDAGQSTARRRQSTTPIQALNLFNSRFTWDAAQALRGVIEREAGPGAGPVEQIRRAYWRVLGREPGAEELREAEPVVRDHGLSALGRVLFNCNEFQVLP